MTFASHGGTVTEPAKRVLILSDDELELLVSWAQVNIQDDDFDEADEELLQKIKSVRLK